jgi:hypothetical protein
MLVNLLKDRDSGLSLLAFWLSSGTLDGNVVAAATR